MEDKHFQYRMYFFVPYNISPIQQAIQAGHAALEYANKYGKTQEFIDFFKNDKTWVILNGGTTNENVEKPGTLQEILKEIVYNAIKFSVFQEPDLNDTLTAICFLADERVWDFENYLDFKDYLISQKVTYTTFSNESITLKSFFALTFDELKEIWPVHYKDWEKQLGGEKNVFLRNLIKGKKLA